MIRRGEIHWVTFDPIQGREQAGRRPALVVSRDEINAAPLTVVVMPGSDAANYPKDYLSNVRVPRSESGLPMDAVFLGYQVRAIDPSRLLDPFKNTLLQPAGRLSDVWMKAVEMAICHTLAIRVAKK